jgi:hypothetical protein
MVTPSSRYDRPDSFAPPIWATGTTSTPAASSRSWYSLKLRQSLAQASQICWSCWRVLGWPVRSAPSISPLVGALRSASMLGATRCRP